jgi:anaerobic ribonucleoside-triphosphate reductase activating protein
MRIADTIQDSIVDGPGFRFVVFTQGCFHNCPGCHNPATHDPDGGKEIAVEDVIREMRKNPLTDGVTLSGGEPFLQPAACADIAEAAKADGLNVWAYSGWTYEELLKRAEADPETARLLRLVDVLVDGPFILAEKSMDVKWRGSRNQRLIDVKRSLEEGTAVIRD